MSPRMISVNMNARMRINGGQGREVRCERDSERYRADISAGLYADGTVLLVDS